MYRDHILANLLKENANLKEQLEYYKNIEIKKNNKQQFKLNFKKILRNITKAPLFIIVSFIRYFPLTIPLLVGCGVATVFIFSDKPDSPCARFCEHEGAHVVMSTTNGCVCEGIVKDGENFYFVREIE